MKNNEFQKDKRKEAIQSAKIPDFSGGIHAQFNNYYFKYNPMVRTLLIRSLVRLISRASCITVRCEAWDCLCVTYAIIPREKWL